MLSEKGSHSVSLACPNVNATNVIWSLVLARPNVRAGFLESKVNRSHM